MKIIIIPTLLVAGLMAACASAPVRYYTLVGAAAPAAVAPRAEIAFELLPVRLPQQADQKSLVVRVGAGQVDLRDDAQWAAPLADEFRVAMSAALSRRSGALDVAAVSRSGASQVVQISIDVQRFELARSGSAGLDAVWSARWPGADALRCQATLSEPAGAGSDAELVEGQQRLLGRLADQIAAALLRSATDRPIATCPSA